MMALKHLKVPKIRIRLVSSSLVKTCEMFKTRRDIAKCLERSRGPPYPGARRTNSLVAQQINLFWKALAS